MDDTKRYLVHTYFEKGRIETIHISKETESSYWTNWDKKAIENQRRNGKDTQYSKYFVSKESAVAYAKEIITKKIDYFEREIAELRERLSGL